MKAPVSVGLFKRKIVNPLLDLLKQGLTPEKLSLTIAIGAVIGLLPFLGLTTIICTALAIRLRLNVAGTVLVSYLVHPIQLLLLIPFLKMGNFLSGNTKFPFSLSAVINMFKNDWVGALQNLWLTNLMGILAWLLIAIPLTALLYFIALPVFRRILAKQAKKQVSA